MTNTAPVINDMQRFYDQTKEAVTENPNLNYFSFALFPLKVSQRIHHTVEFILQEMETGLIAVAKILLERGYMYEKGDLWSRLNIPSWMGYWIKTIAKDYKGPLLWGRPDIYIHEGKIKILETNFASTAGYQQQVSGLCDWMQTSKYPGHADIKSLRFLNPLLHFGAAIKPSVKDGLVLFPDVLEEGRNDHLNAKPYFGLTKYLRDFSVINGKGELIPNLIFEKDGVYCQGERVEHVFMSYYNPHVFNTFGEYAAFWDLYRKGKLNILDSLFEVILANKALLAFVSENASELPLTNDQKQIFLNHLPWTRILEDREVITPEGRKNLLRYVEANKSKLILKSIQGAEGKSVYIGQSLSQQTWNDFLSDSANHGKFIIQERVNTRNAQVPFYSKDDLVVRDCDMLIGPYYCHRKVCGYLVRFYTEEPVKDPKGTKAAADFCLSAVGTVGVMP